MRRDFLPLLAPCVFSNKAHIKPTNCIMRALGPSEAGEGGSKRNGTQDDPMMVEEEQEEEQENVFTRENRRETSRNSG